MWQAIGTGYFGRPETYNKSGRKIRSMVSNVHFVRHRNDKKPVPICGYKPHPTMEYLFCAAFPVHNYVTCKECHKRLKKLEETATKDKRWKDHEPEASH